MRWTIVALLVLLLPCGSSAQQMIKVNMVELYDKVPPPPVDAKEAFARCEKVGEDNPTNCLGSRPHIVRFVGFHDVEWNSCPISIA